MKTEYTLSKHRYYELKHFCLQYPDWIKEYRDADGWSGKGDTTSRDGIKRAEIIRFVDLIQTCAYDTNRDLLPFVTGESISIPSELLYFYRKFFWELSRRR